MCMSCSSERDSQSRWCSWAYSRMTALISGREKQSSMHFRRSICCTNAVQFCIILKFKQMDFKNMFTSKSSEDEESCIPKLSFQQRMLGFAICCVLGYVIQFLSFGAFISIVTGNPAKFAIIYSVGNVLSLAATGFLLGFRRQLRNMVDKDRLVTSIVFMLALFGTVFSAIVLTNRVLVIICLAVQIPAYIWYCATYIPFARNCIKSCLRGIARKCGKKLSLQSQV